MARRILVSYLALTLLVLVVLEVPLALGERRRLETELTAELTEDAFAMAQYAEETLEGHADVDLAQLTTAYEERTGARALIVDRSGQSLADSGRASGGEDFTNRTEVAEALAGRVATGVRRSETLGDELLYVAVPVASGEVFGAIRLSYGTAEIDARLRRYWVGLGLVAAASLAAAALVGVILARWVSRPLERVGDAATRLGDGDLDSRSPADAGPPEVRQLAASFNETAERLQALVVAQDEFVADASHQLRTPLTAQRLRLENLRDELEATDDSSSAALDTAAAREDLDAALAEGTRLARLVDGLLALARADRRAPTADARAIEVEDLLEDRAATWEPLAAEQGVDLAATTEPGLAVTAAPDRVVQAVDNLVANALDAVGPGSRVALQARQVGDRIELHVLDDGPGLSEEQRTHAFDRFWRAGHDTGRFGGTGLGLAIVRKLVEADGGTAELRAGPDGGVDATLSYPATGPRPADPPQR